MHILKIIYLLLKFKFAFKVKLYGATKIYRITLCLSPHKIEKKFGHLHFLKLIFSSRFKLKNIRIL